MIRRALATLWPIKRNDQPRIPFHVCDWTPPKIEAGIRAAKAPPRAAFEAKFRSVNRIADDASVAFVGSGRSALKLALAVLKRAAPGRTKIVLPTYCCSALIPPVIENGLVPVFIDTTEHLISSRQQYCEALGPDVLAVILVNLCGRRLPHSEIEAVVHDCHEQGAFAIEDNCQDVTRHLGDETFDASFFSFGFAKPVRATAGGALVMSRYEDFLHQELDAYEPQPEEAAATRMRYYAGRFAPPDVSDLDKGAAVSPADFSAARIEYGSVRMSDLDCVLAYESLERLAASVAGVARHSSLIATAVANNRASRRVFRPAQALLNSFVRWPIVMSNAEIAGSFWSFMTAQGIELEGMYKPLHLSHAGECPRELRAAEAIYECVYNIPNRADLDRISLRRIRSALKTFEIENT